MTNEKTDLGSPPDKQAALDTLFADLPTGFEDRYRALQQLRLAFHEKLAAVLEPALNDHVKRQPAENLQDRRRLATWVDEITREVGATTVLPSTGQPVLLAANLSDRDDPQSAMFRMFFKNQLGGISFTAGSSQLPELHLRAAPSEVEMLFRRQRKAYAPERPR